MPTNEGETTTELKVSTSIPIEPRLITYTASKKEEPCKIYPVFKDIKSTNLGNDSRSILLSEQCNLFEINFNSKQGLECKEMKKLSNIVQIESSLSHFMALEKEELPHIKHWTPQQVA